MTSSGTSGDGDGRRVSDRVKSNPCAAPARAEPRVCTGAPPCIRVYRDVSRDSRGARRAVRATRREPRATARICYLERPWLDLASMAAPRCRGSPSPRWPARGSRCLASICRGKKASRATATDIARAQCCAATARAGASAPSATPATSPTDPRSSPARRRPAAASRVCPAARARAGRRTARVACNWASQPAPDARERGVLDVNTAHRLSVRPSPQPSPRRAGARANSWVVGGVGCLWLSIPPVLLLIGTSRWAVAFPSQPTVRGVGCLWLSIPSVLLSFEMIRGTKSAGRSRSLRNQRFALAPPGGERVGVRGRRFS